MARSRGVAGAHALLVSAAVMSGLLCGCGTGPASIGAGPASTADPGLHRSAVRSAPATAAGLAREIAARWSASGAPPFTRNLPIKFRTLDYAATVFSPGSPKGFTAFVTTRRTTTVTTASAATIVASNGASARFATTSGQAMWQAAGRPSLGQAPPNAMQTISAGQYSFIPQGRNLTYRLAAGLPAERDSLAAVLAGYLRGYAGPHPPVSVKLKEVAYLIATAPLTDAVRAAAWQVMASLPGLSICPDLPGQADPGAIGLCVGSSGDQTIVTVDPATGAIVTIADRLTQTSPDYPHVAAGTVVGSSTFLSG